MADPLLELLGQILTDPDPKARIKRTQAVYSQINGILARASFAEFVKQAWPTLEPGTHLEWNWHHQLMCDVLQAMFHAWQDAKTQRGRHQKVRSFDEYVRNAIFSVPPGSLKSRIIAVSFQPWCWLHEPSMRFICLSVNEDATLRDGRMSRDLIKSDWYQQTFRPHWSLKTDQDAISNYGNTHGGDRLSKPSGSEVVGLRGDCVSGDALIYTELGEIPIKELHNAALQGLPLPKVWTVDNDGNLILNKVLATRKTRSVNTVTVCTEHNNVLTCTDDHKIYNHRDNQYTKAKQLAGSQVSILRQPEQTVKNGHTAKVRRLPLRETEMHTVPKGVYETRCRVRQAKEARAGTGAFLQQVMQSNRDWFCYSGKRDKLSELWTDLQAEIPQKDAADLLDKMPRQFESKEQGCQDFTRQTLFTVRKDDGYKIDSPNVLQSGLCRETPRYSDDGEPESSFQKLPEVRRESMGETVTANQGAGFEYLCRVWGVEQLESSVNGPSYRPRSSEQYTRESDNSLRSLPHDSPQIKTSTVLSVEQTFEATSGREIDVYDLHVEGIHNFIANGVSCSNCLLIDDPNNPKEAENALERNKINELWTTNIANRVNDPRRSLRIGVQQRVHKQDWTGYVLELQKPWAPDNQFGWLNIVLPAEYDPKRKFVMPDCLRKYVRWPNAVLEDPRTIEGESIHRDRFTPEYLAAEKERWKHTTNYSGQMQQSPAAAEGQLVQRKWWGWFRFAEGVREDLVTGDHPRPLQSHEGPALVVHQKLYHPGQPDFDWITISVDPAAKKTEKGSAYGLLAIAGKGGRRFVLDDRTQRGAFHEILDIIKDMIKTWKPDSILIEPKAAGPDLMDTLREQMLAGDLPMVTIEEAEPGNQDKEMRLQGALPTIKNGAVYLLEGAPWLKDFLDELSEFPASDQSDRVDALSQCLNNKRAVDDSLPGW